MEKDQLVTQLHSPEIRSDYTCQPSAFLSNCMQFNHSLFNNPPLTDDERKLLIERYPGMKDTDYQPPDTIPLAARSMKSNQTKQDRSLKRLQYLTSGTFRPLDVLALEISQDNSNPNVQRYLRMLANCRLLLLNLSPEMTEMRKYIAFQAINPRFSSTSISSNTNYIMSLDEFQTALSQHTTNLQNVQKASLVGHRTQFRNTNHNNSKFSINSIRRPTQSVLFRVDNTFNRKLATSNNSISHQPSTTHDSLQHRTTTFTTPRNPISITERSSRSGFSATTINNTQILQSTLRDSQEKRRSSTCLQLQKTQLVHHSTSL